MRKALLVLLLVLGLVSDISGQARFGRTPLSETVPESGGTPAVLSQSELVLGGSGVATTGLTTNVTTYATVETFSVASNQYGICYLGTTDGSGSTDKADQPTSVTMTGYSPVVLEWRRNNSGTVGLTIVEIPGTGAAAASISAVYPDAQNGFSAHCEKFSNVDTSDPIRAYATSYADDAGTSLTGAGTVDAGLVLANRGASTLVSGVVFSQGNCTISPYSAYTGELRITYATPNTSMRAFNVVGGTDTIPAATISACSDLNSVDFVVAAVEINPSTSGGDTTDPIGVIDLPTGNVTYNVSSALDQRLGGFYIEANIASITISCSPACSPASPTVTIDETNRRWLSQLFNLSGCSGGGGTNTVATVTFTDDAANDSQLVFTYNCRTPDNVAPLMTIISPVESSLTVASAGATTQVVITGTSSDETSLNDNVYALSGGTTASGTCNGTTSWTCTLTINCSGGGTSTVATLNARDTVPNLSQNQVRTYNCVSADATVPTVSINSNFGAGAGNNGTSATVPIVITFTATDNVGLDRVDGTSSASCAPATWTVDANGTSQNLSSPPISCPIGAVGVHTVIAYDQAGNASSSDSQTVTYQPSVQWSTQADLGDWDTVGSSKTFQLVAVGGSGAITYSEVAGSALADDAQCAGITMNASGLLTIDPTTTGECDFTIRASAGSTSDKSFHLDVCTGCETAHSFYEGLLTTYSSSILFNRSLRDEAQINPLRPWDSLADNAGFKDVWSYVYPLASPSSLCRNSSCNDSYTTPKDGLKFRIGPDTPSTNNSLSSGNQIRFQWGTSWYTTPGDTVMVILDAWMAPEIYYSASTEQGCCTAGGYNYKTFMFVLDADKRWDTILFNFRNGRLSDQTLGTIHNEVTGGGGGQEPEDTGQVSDGVNYPMFPAGMSNDEGVCIAGLNAPCQRPFAAPNGRRAPWGKWLRFYYVIKPYNAYTDFASWNQACNCTLQANPQDRTGAGRWHQLTFLMMVEDDPTVYRILYQVPMHWGGPASINNWTGIPSGWRLEMNTSKTEVLGEFIMYFRNVVVIKNYPFAATIDSDTNLFKSPRP